LASQCANSAFLWGRSKPVRSSGRSIPKHCWAGEVPRVIASPAPAKTRNRQGPSRLPIRRTTEFYLSAPIALQWGMRTLTCRGYPKQPDC
jgi:hypothetical protein